MSNDISVASLFECSIDHNATVSTPAVELIEYLERFVLTIEFRTQ